MITVTLYTRADCELCKQAEEDLKALQDIVPHQLAILDIDSDPALRDIFRPGNPGGRGRTLQIESPFYPAGIADDPRSGSRPQGAVGKYQR